jgi:hypothetical protein
MICGLIEYTHHNGTNKYAHTRVLTFIYTHGKLLHVLAIQVDCTGSGALQYAVVYLPVHRRPW